MEKTTIDLKKETRDKLNKIKYKLGLKSYDNVINSLLGIIVKYKLAHELEEVSKWLEKDTARSVWRIELS